MTTDVQHYVTPCCGLILFDRKGVRSFFWDMRLQQQCPACGKNQDVAYKQQAQKEKAS